MGSWRYCKCGAPAPAPWDLSKHTLCKLALCDNEELLCRKCGMDMMKFYPMEDFKNELAKQLAELLEKHE